MEDKEKIEKAIMQARASILIDGLPLSDEYVENYRNERLNKLENDNSKKLVLKRGEIHAKNRGK